MSAAMGRKSHRHRSGNQKRRLTFESLEIRSLLAAGLGDETLVELSATAAAAINVRLVPVAVASPSDTAAELPAALAGVAGPGKTFLVEVWARNADSSAHGIVGGYLDLSFDTRLADATALAHGGVYSELVLGTIDNTAGRIDDLGGIAAPGVVNLGDNEWVRLASVSFRSTQAGTLLVSPCPGVDGLARAGEGAIAWSSVDLAAASVTILPADPTTPGLFDPATCLFYLRDANSTGMADWTFGYGDPAQAWTPLAGDWDGNMAETTGFFDPQTCTWSLRNSLSAGYADWTFGYGDPTQHWIPLVGDWDGDGHDTVGFYAPATCTWFLRDSLSAGFADRTFGYGDPAQSWLPLVGDWNGDGVDTIGFYDPQTAIWYLRDSLSTGYADWTFGYGAAGEPWKPLVGDWNGDGVDTIGFFDPAQSVFFLRNALSPGFADVTFGYGAPGQQWLPLVGSWQAEAKLDGDASTLAGDTWLDFAPGDAAGSGAAAVVSIQETAGGLSGHVSVPGAWLAPVTIAGHSMARLTVPDLGTTDGVGLPELPLVRSLLTIPAGATVVVEVSGPEQVITLSDAGVDLQLSPLQEPVPKTADAGHGIRSALNEWAYAVDCFLPQDAVRLIPAGYHGGEQVMVVEVRPVAYNPLKRSLKVRPEIDFQIQITPPEESAPPAAQKAAAGRLLVIAHNDFAAGLASFVAFKTSLGWTVDVADTSTAGTTTTAIKGYIQGRYDNPATKPEAVLLVGDTDRIPSFTGVGADNPATDLYYVTMDAGDDWYPDMAIGRFSVADTTQLADVVEKTIAYETSPSGAWKKDAAFLAGNDNYGITEGTHNSVISQYMDPRGYTSDKLYEQTYGATTQNVRDALNNGRVMAIYSGHGSETSWADGPVFSQSDVQGLANQDMYPFVVSFSCLTGSYTLPECFAETWLRSADKGAVDMLASSVTSYWNEDDILEKKLFSAIYDDSQTTFGAATLRAKELYLEHYGPGGSTRRYFEMYNLFGDPTVTLTGLTLGVISPAEAPTAYLGEPYQFTLQASSGTQPYQWSITAGGLPAGLALIASTGVISGTPAATADAHFTVQVTDGALATATQDVHLPVVERLVVSTASPLPTASPGVAYSVTLQAAGGTAPYTWSVAGVGQYEEDLAGSHYLGGGTAQGWRADDGSWSLNLPFAFPFYGGSFNSVHVCSNGFLDFVSGSTEYSNSDAELKANARIAPLWDDLLTNGAGEDIYVSQGADYVGIRWDGETYSGAHPVDFEVVLHRDGTIDFNYGEAHSGLSPTIGISKGDGTSFALSARDNATTIPVGVSSRLTYVEPLPPGLSLFSAGVLSGTPTQVGSFAFDARVVDSGATQQTVSKTFQVDVSGSLPLGLTLPAFVTEGSGTLSEAGTVSIPVAAAADLSVALAWAGGSEISSPAGVTIPAGQLSANFDLVVDDDALLDGTQVSGLSATAAGYAAASALVNVHDNETTVITLSLPDSAAEGSVSVKGTVTLAAAPAKEVPILLQSSDATEASAPSFVLVPAGATSAEFNLAILDDTMIDATQAATVSAVMENWTPGADTIQVLDNDATMSLELPAKLWEGQGTRAAAGVVKLGGTVLADLDVTLASDDTSELRVPATVTVRQGQSTAAFDLTVVDDSEKDGAKTAGVSASATGLPAANGTVVIGDNEVDHFAFTPIFSPQIAGSLFPVTITAVDVAGDRIEVYEGTLDVAAVGDHGSIPVQISAKGEDDGSDGADPVDPSTIATANVKGLGVYHDYDALSAELGAYAAAHPDICRLVTLGKSIQGRELWAMKISDNPDVDENEPEAKYVGSIHGDEPVGAELCLYLIDDLLGGYGTDPRVTSLVNSTEVWIVPLMNPDGRQAGTRENALGADLNRSFPDGAETSIGDVYHGPAMQTAGRPLEVVEVMNWSAAHSFTVSAGLHGGALVVNYPYDNDGLGSVDSPTPDDALFEHVALDYSTLNQPMYQNPQFPQGITNGADWYVVVGGMQDWNYRYLGTNEVTIEVSNQKWPAAAALPGLWSDNQASMLGLLESAQMGVHGLVTDAAGTPIYAEVRVVGNSHLVFTDPQAGDYHRMLLPGTYDLTFSAPGYQSRTIAGVAASEAGTALDVTLVASGSGVVMFGGQWAGQVAVEGADTGVRLHAADAQANGGQSNAFDVVHGVLDHFQFNTIPSPQWVGTPVSITVSARDSSGFLVDDFTGTVDLSCHTAVDQVTLGGGTATTGFPLDTGFDDCRTQTIYLADELGGPRMIDGLALDLTALPGHPLRDFTIRLKHTQGGSYTTPAWEGSGWTEVYRATTSFISTGWVNIPLTTPFDYNGTDNLLVDLSFNGLRNTTSGATHATDSGAVRTITYSTDSAYGDPLAWSGTTNPAPVASSLIPNVRLGGRHEVPITPTVSGAFVAGSWSGTITLAEAGLGLVLAADDHAGHQGTSNAFNASSSTYDMDGSGRVGTGDYGLFSPAWQSRPGDANWNPAADFDRDGLVGQSDFDAIKANWLKDVGKLGAALASSSVDEGDLDLLAASALDAPNAAEALADEVLAQR